MVSNVILELRNRLVKRVALKRADQLRTLNRQERFKNNGDEWKNASTWNCFREKTTHSAKIKCERLLNISGTKFFFESRSSISFDGRKKRFATGQSYLPLVATFRPLRCVSSAGLLWDMKRAKGNRALRPEHVM